MPNQTPDDDISFEFPDVFDKSGKKLPLRLVEESNLEFPGMCLGERNRHSYPYSYDPYLQWSKQQGVPADAQGVYSDRMRQWNYALYRELCQKHFAGKNGDPGGDYFNRRKPKDIEAFLREYFSKPKLELVRVEEHCNMSSGYPIWVFYYRDHDATATPEKVAV